MLQKRKFQIVLVIALICLLYGFLPTQAQNRVEKRYNAYVQEDSMTTKIICHNPPNTKTEFEDFLDEITKNVKLKEWDDLKFWLYISIVNDVYGELKIGYGNTYEKAADEFLDTANYWLKNNYKKRMRGKNSI